MKKLRSSYNSSYSMYDYFVMLHYNAVFPSAQVHTQWRFFPWHREMMKRYSMELQKAANDSTLAIPYWDWTDPQSTAALLDLNYIGGEGTYENNYTLAEGNFQASSFPLDIAQGLYSIPNEAKTGGLLRALGNGLQSCLDQYNSSYFLDTVYNPPFVDNLTTVGPFQYIPANSGPEPTQIFLSPHPANLLCNWSNPNCIRSYSGYYQNQYYTMACKHYGVGLPTYSNFQTCVDAITPSFYDTSIVNGSRTNPSVWAAPLNYIYANPFKSFFRSCVEGSDPTDKYSFALERVGASVHPPHGATHTYMGGSLATIGSPNDPIFFHLHCNVDRYWAQFQNANSSSNEWFTSGPAKNYSNLAMPSFYNPPVSPSEILDFRALGYTYDDIC